MLVLILQLLAVGNILRYFPGIHDRKRRIICNIEQRAGTTIVLNLEAI